MAWGGARRWPGASGGGGASGARATKHALSLYFFPHLLHFFSTTTVWPSFYRSRGYHSGVALQGYAPCCLSSSLARCADGTRSAGLVRYYGACRDNDAFCKSAAVDYRRTSSMRIPRRRQEISPWDTPATCLESLNFGRYPEPSPVRSFLLARGGALSHKPSPPAREGILLEHASLPAMGRGLITSFSLNRRALPSARQRLAEL
jgi:hypothetical protein